MSPTDNPPMRVTPLRFSLSCTGDGTTRLKVAGEVDMATVAQLTDRLARIVADPFVRTVVVDFADVAFLGSSGIQALVTAHRLAERGHVDLRVAHCRPIVLRVLEITGVDKLLTSDY
jgi:anti-anti-sigma factor